MLRRQRTVLAALEAAGGSTSALGIQKRLFLLRQETGLADDPAFYDFVPYRFGPFSFVAAREMEAMLRLGYLRRAGHTVALSAMGAGEAARAERGARQAARYIQQVYGRRSMRETVGEIYRRYPWYASRSELTDLRPKAAQPTPARAAAYTVGYGGRSVDGFLGLLLRAGMEGILDVRANPVSRKYGFCGSTLRALAAKLGLAYAHHPELGISSGRRREAQAGAGTEAMFKSYERHLLAAGSSGVDAVARELRQAPSALLCMERRAQDCHRLRLAHRVSALTGLAVVHL